MAAKASSVAGTISPHCEFSPSPKFAAHIERFWLHRTDASVRNYRVLPDGCSDLIFERPAREYGGLALIGTMTRAQAFDIPPRQLTFGVRFHPGMATKCVGVPGSLAVDQAIPLADLWKPNAVRELLEQLGESECPQNSVARFEAALADPLPLDPVDKALAWLGECNGQVSIDGLASSASLSARQFRRLCIARTGLSPKHLARMLRFRHAASFASNPHRDWASVALDCGYYDQAHLINDFRELTGVTPAQFASLNASPLTNR